MPLQPMITGARHMIAAGHYLAAEAGHAVLQAGGNVVDAGVAGGIALEIVHSDQVQFSGVAPMVIHLAERDETITIAGLGGWPRAARLQTFVEQHGGAIPYGVLRTVVPAAPEAWILALERYGTMSFGDVAAAAIRYAREGFTMHPVMAHFIDRYADGYRRWPANAAIWLPGGHAPREGERFVQADLARSMQFMVDEERAASSRGRVAGLHAARDAFYRGDLATAMVRYHQDNGGWLTAEDLASYRSEITPPVRTTFGGMDVFTCGPWCQGPVLLQMLSLLKGVDLKSLGHNTPAYVHLVTEAMKLCFADRERYYGDPRVVEVPMDALLAPAYADERRRLIGERACPRDAAGRSDSRIRSGGHARRRGGGRRRRRCRRRRHLVRLRRRSSRQRVLGDAQRLVVGRPGHSRPGLRPVHARLAVLGGAGPRLLRGAGQAPAADAQPGARAPRPRVDHAVRRARRRPSAPGHAAGVPESHGVRHEHPGGGRGAAVRDAQLPGIVRAAPVLSGATRPRAADR